MGTRQPALRNKTFSQRSAQVSTGGFKTKQELTKRIAILIMRNIQEDRNRNPYGKINRKEEIQRNRNGKIQNIERETEESEWKDTKNRKRDRNRNGKIQKIERETEELEWKDKKIERETRIRVERLINRKRDRNQNRKIQK